MVSLIILWLIFGFSHSLLAATSVRAFFEKMTKGKPHLFRLFYNLIALIVLFLIVGKTIELNSLIPILNQFFLTKIIGVLLVLSSFFVLMSVARQMDLLAFFGFKSEVIGGDLMTGGWYKTVRHPLYFGLFLLFSGIFGTFPTLGVALSLAFSQLYVLIGIEFEEKKLRRVFGQPYVDFCSGKKKFVPFIY